MRRPTVAHCREVGKALASLHLAGADFPLSRPNALAHRGLAQAVGRRRARAPTRSSRGLPPRSTAISPSSSGDWPAALAGGHHPCRSLPGQCVLPRRPAVRADRLLFRLQRSLCLRRRHLPQRLVLREGPCLQPDQGHGAAGRLPVGAAAERGRKGGAADAGARLGAALHADPALRLADHPRRRAGPEARPDGIYPQAALPPADRLGAANMESET